MSIKIDLSIPDLDEILGEINESLSPEELSKANKEASRAFAEDVKNWYGEKGSSYWVKPGNTHGSGRISTGWWKGLMNWLSLDGSSTGGGVYFEGEKYGLAQKIKGGTITAKNGKSLTIPLVPAAHGRRVRDYESEIGQLFRPKNKDYLAEIVQGEGIRAVYALRKSVTQDPFPNAVPSDEWISETYGAHFYNTLLD